MEKWSAESEKFRVNFFLDTNILCYLVDDTYSALSEFIKALAEMPVVSLFTSEYVLTELLEVRKKEDYFQEVMNQAKKDGRYINISSFIANNKRYSIPHYPYEGDLIEPVSTQVNKDIEKIVKDFGITFESKFNDSLLSPMKGICLSTKISREDSLVLVSSLFKGDEKLSPGKVILITNDEAFEKWSNGAQAEINNVLAKHGLSMPFVEHLDKMGSLFNDDGTKWNLTKTTKNGRDIALEYVTKCIQWMYVENYIGIISPAENVTRAPAHTLFVKVKADSLSNKIYTIILDKDLNFLYCPQNKADFYRDGSSLSEPFVPTEGQDKVGFVCEMREGEGDEIYEKLNQQGNMVFIHPDSI